MNPSNVKTAADALKVRNAYLANVDAQLRNLDKTKNATTIFAQTGQTPLAPQDTRSVSEKFADVERLTKNSNTTVSSGSRCDLDRDNTANTTGYTYNS